MRLVTKTRLVLFSVFALFALFRGSNTLAQTASELPPPVGHVNDFSGVVDSATKQRLESILENVKQRTGVEFTIATVQTTDGKDIFDFSRQLAGQWNIGLRTSTSKSLLLVVAVSEKTFFTQFSRNAQAELPEGILGDMNLRMREPIESGRFSEGLLTGIKTFVGVVGGKAGFTLGDIEPTASESAAGTNQVAPGTRPALKEGQRPRRVLALTRLNEGIGSSGKNEPAKTMEKVNSVVANEPPQISTPLSSLKPGASLDVPATESAKVSDANAAKPNAAVEVPATESGPAKVNVSVNVPAPESAKVSNADTAKSNTAVEVPATESGPAKVNVPVDVPATESAKVSDANAAKPNAAVEAPATESGPAKVNAPVDVPATESAKVSDANAAKPNAAVEVPATESVSGPAKVNAPVDVPAPGSAKVSDANAAKPNAAVEVPATESVSAPPKVNAPVDVPATESTKIAPVGRKKPTTAAESPNIPTADVSKNASALANDAEEAEEVELTLTLPVASRVEKLKDFLLTHPNSLSRRRATELLVGARAALGDQKLKNGDNAAGVEQMTMAIADSPQGMSEKLFSGVVAQIPLNLYLRGERAAAFKAAQAIESRFSSDPRRLLAVAGFYLTIEQSSEAARIATQTIKLAPSMAEAHNLLGVALHISLQLDDAAAEYKRALELDPNSKGARRSLADIYRSAGKAEEALGLYREQFKAEAQDKAARAGLVLSLFDLERRDEAEKELEAALKDEPRNLPLLAGAGYWFVAHSDSKRGQGLARKAVEVEPRYAWAQIALARALVVQKRPLEAEKFLRFMQQYGKFPTLDYELATALGSAGLYEEAAEVLTRSFSLKDGQIETQLAGRVPARGANFLELLAPERRASIFQFTAADTEANARTMKGLLALTLAANPQADSIGVDESAAVAAAREFAAGDDEMRPYRQLYAAGLLVRRGVGLQVAQEFAEGAGSGVESAISIPAATVAVQADELRELRARAIALGGTPDLPDAPRSVLANILRGRIEDIVGWALFYQDKTSQAVERLRRAVSVLPENTPSWRTALWHLGVALQQSGNNDEALTFYIKSYNAGEQDPVRRAVIEQLYQKVKGSLDGLDDRIGPALKP